MQKFNKGDRVKLPEGISSINSYFHYQAVEEKYIKHGDTGLRMNEYDEKGGEVIDHNNGYVIVKFPTSTQTDDASHIKGYTQLGFKEEDLTLFKTTNSKIMNIKQTIKQAFKKEPEKSFIKAGIITVDEDFTDEGKEVFLNFLLKKYGDDFKKEVADVIIASQKEEKE